MREKWLDELVWICARDTLKVSGKDGFVSFMLCLSSKIFPFPKVEDFNELFQQICPMRFFDENGKSICHVIDAQIIDYDLKLSIANEGDQQFRFQPEMRELIIREALHRFFWKEFNGKTVIGWN